MIKVNKLVISALLLLLPLKVFSAEECRKVLKEITLYTPWIQELLLKQGQPSIVLPFPHDICLAEIVTMSSDFGEMVGSVKKEAESVVRLNDQSLMNQELPLLSEYKEFLNKHVPVINLYQATQLWFQTQVLKELQVNYKPGNNPVRLVKLSFVKNKSYNREWNRYTSTVPNKIKEINYEGVINSLGEDGTTVFDLSQRDLGSHKVWRIPGAIQPISFSSLPTTGAMKLDDLSVFCSNIQSHFNVENPKSQKTILYGSYQDDLKIYQAYFCIPTEFKESVFWYKDAFFDWNKYKSRLWKDIETSTDVAYSEFKKYKSENTATVVDARSFIQYSKEHIPGAIALPMFNGRDGSVYTIDIGAFKSDDPIIVYGQNSKDKEAAFVVEYLKRKGKKVLFYRGGLSDWLHHDEVLSEAEPIKNK